MDLLSYLATFVALVLGLAVANVLADCSVLVKRGRSVRWYWVHALWSAWLLVFMAVEWWNLLHWRAADTINFFVFLFLLIKPALLFFASDLLFPETESRLAYDLKEHFFDVHRSFFIVLAALPALDMVDTLLKGVAYFRSLGPGYPLYMACAILLTASGALTREARHHAALVVLAYGLLLAAVVDLALTA